MGTTSQVTQEINQVLRDLVAARDEARVRAHLMGMDARKRLGDLEQVLGHPKAGASWEGFALEQVLAHVDGDPYFWATHAGAELDLILLRRRERWGFEFKLSGSPKLTKSMHIAMTDLRLAHLWVVHAGSDQIALADRVTAIPLSDVTTLATRGP